jgi:hypothetical protein
MRWFPPLLRLTAPLTLVAGLTMIAVPHPAWAQLGMGSMPSASNPQGAIGGPTMIGPPPTTKAPAAAPDALPGAVSHSDRVTPAQGGAITDPNEALFDAINRGDIASARDALDRGADYNARNVLGMTPLDLSVDLGRSDITFLLLSLQNGEVRPNGVRTATQTAKAGATAGKPAPGAKAVAHPAPAAKQVAKAAPAPKPTGPQLFAGDGGTPDPGAGFLGFDNRH